MIQTKRRSLVEVMINTTVGYLFALAGQLIVFPLYGIHVHLSDNLGIGLFFTVISIIRSFIIRRCFNYLDGRKLK